MLLDHKGKPLQDSQDKLNETMCKILDNMSGCLMKGFSKMPENSFTESLGPVGDLRESCGLPRMKGGSGTIKFRRYETLKYVHEPRKGVK